MRLNNIQKVTFSCFILINILILFSCKDEESRKREYPRVITREVTNITGKGAQFNAEIISAGTEGIVDHGFLFSLYSGQGGNSDTFSLGNFKGIGNFEFQFDTTFDEIKTYYVRAYIKTLTYTVLGDWVEFVCLGKDAPILSSFYPVKDAFWGDTITLTGKNFSGIKKNIKIYFNDSVVIPFYISDTLLRAIIPLYLNNPVKVSIEVLGNIALIEQSLSLLEPLLLDFFPKQGVPGDTVTFTLNVDVNNLFVNVRLVFTNHHEPVINTIIKNGKEVKIVIPVDIIESHFRFGLEVGDNQLGTINFSTPIPEIISFSSDKVKDYSPLTIKGKYFIKNHTSIKIGNVEYPLNVIDPQTANLDDFHFEFFNLQSGYYIISVIVFDQIAESKNKILYTKPIIEKSSSYEVFYNDTLTLYGKYLVEDNENIKYIFYPENSWSYNYVHAKIIFSSPDSIKVIVPENIDTLGYANLEFEGYSYWFKDIKYKLKKPVIQSVSTRNVGNGDIVTVKGKNFPYLSDYYIGSNNIAYEFKASYISSNELTIEVIKCLTGSQEIKLATNRPTKYNFSLGTFVFTSNSPYKIIKQIYDPILNRGGTHSFSYINNNQLYIDANFLFPTICKFDFSTSKWSYLNTNVDLFDPSSFVLNNKAYMISNYGDTKLVVNQYDFQKNKFIALSDFPGKFRRGYCAFVIDNKGFFGLGNSKDLWEYNETNDIWSHKTDFPGTSCYSPNIFIIGSKVYFVIKNETWEYDYTTNIWTKKKEFPGTARYCAISFSSNNFGHIISGAPIDGVGGGIYYRDSWRYDQANDKWQKGVEYPGEPGYGGIGFIKDNIIYVGLSLNYFNVNDLYYSGYDFFEYDPSLDKFVDQ